MLNLDESGFQKNPIIRLNATLPFNFKEGACATGNDPDGNEFALLCFDREAPRKCYTCSDLENGECHPIESFPTRDTTRNAIKLIHFEDKVYACGGWATLTCDVMDMKDGKFQWKSMVDFPCSNPSGPCMG